MDSSDIQEVDELQKKAVWGRPRILRKTGIDYQRPGSDGNCPEWAMIDLQGNLETRQSIPLSGKFVGDLHFTMKNDVPILIIGHHILYGKVTDLEKPYAVIVKDSNSEQDNSTSEDNSETSRYVVKALIKKKLLFKQRPKPIIANVPKKL